MRPVKLFHITPIYILKRLIFFQILLTLVFFAFPPADAATDYNIEDQGPFARLDKRWKTDSAEVELKFKNLSDTDIEAVRKRLYYLFITSDEFDFLIARLLKSENEKAHELAGLILNDPAIGYYSKMSILSTFRAYLSAAGDEKITSVQRIAENFAVSDICKISGRLYITSLKTIAAAKTKTAEAFFISRFNSEENSAVKRELLYELSHLPAGVELLAAEYEKAVSKKEYGYSLDVLNSISSLKTPQAYDHLYALMQKTGSEGDNAPLYNFIRNCAARCASEKFTACIEKLLVSQNTAEAQSGFDYLRYYPQKSVRIALTAYSKISGEKHKKYYLRKLAEFIKSLNLSYGKAEAEELKAVYSFIEEAVASGEPFLKRIAFETLSQNLKNDDFKKLAEKGAADFGALTPLAFYLNGEKERFIDYINAPRSASNLIDNREIISSYASSFEFNESEFKTEESTLAFFNFIKSQSDYFQNRMIEKIVKTGNAGLIKKLAAFSSSCKPGFINTLKRRIIEAINESPALRSDDYLIKFIDYESSREYQNSLIFQKKFDAAGGNLKKYLLAVKNAGGDEYAYAAEKISQLVRKAPQEFIASIKDDRFPPDAKLMLIRAAGERLAELKQIIDAAALKEFICRPEVEASILSAAAALLAKLDESAAFESLKTALKNSAGDSQRETAVLRSFSFIGAKDRSEFIACDFIEPYLKALPQTPSEKDVEDFFKKAPQSLSAACELLNGGDESSIKAVDGLIRRNPAFAPALIGFFNAAAGEEALKHYLASFDIKSGGGKIIGFLRRGVTQKNMDILMEHYLKSPPEKDNAILWAALFYKIGIYAPASLFISKAETVNRVDVFKLLEAGFGNDFITDFYPAGEKFIDTLTPDELKNFRHAAEAARDFKSRYAAADYAGYEDENFSSDAQLDLQQLNAALSLRAYLDNISRKGIIRGYDQRFLVGALQSERTSVSDVLTIARLACAEKLSELKSAACLKLKSLVSTSEINIKSYAGEPPEKCFSSYLDCCDINDFEEAASILQKSVRNKIIAPDFYVECAFRICAEFDSAAAGFDAMDLKRKNDIVKRITANGYFDVKKAFPKNAHLYALDFETLCAEDAADIKFIDAVIKEHKGWDYEYIEDLFLARLLKTAAMEEKLKFITGLIDSSDANDNGQLLEMAGSYITAYG
ncbi:MAG TPA: hypothetical protein PK467_02410, partial [Candidatus Wallbacteria bacterium]|nr:hypothetical protein [Candidatus Wallbacteria bacterium]